MASCRWVYGGGVGLVDPFQNVDIVGDKGTNHLDMEESGIVFDCQDKALVDGIEHQGEVEGIV